MSKRLLVVAAHPDDEILGCGGTVARLVTEGWEAYSLILGEGVTSRDTVRSAEIRENDFLQLECEMKAAHKIIGFSQSFNCKFPDNRFDTVSLLDIIKEVEKVKEQVKPELIFTHYDDDLNIDHKICNRAVITATRPMPGESVKQILAFEILSSTEWNFPNKFNANYFYNIESSINKKILAMDAYKSEIREFPHPRSRQGIELNAKVWGMKIGFSYAEVFNCLRCVN